jgi:hypothetical protein
MSCFGKRAWDPNGKVSFSSPIKDGGKEQPDLFQHCYVTGGSTGLGLALSILLAQQGADVSIVARNEKNLKAAAEKLEVRLFAFRACRKLAYHPSTGRSSIERPEVCLVLSFVDFRKGVPGSS